MTLIRLFSMLLQLWAGCAGFSRLKCYWFSRQSSSLLLQCQRMNSPQKCHASRLALYWCSRPHAIDAWAAVPRPAHSRERESCRRHLLSWAWFTFTLSAAPILIAGRAIFRERERPIYQWTGVQYEEHPLPELPWTFLSAIHSGFCHSKFRSIFSSFNINPLRSWPVFFLTLAAIELFLNINCQLEFVNFPKCYLTFLSSIYL